MLNLLSHFPSGDEPRPEQTKLLTDIQSAIEAGIKYIIVQAPTGVGKSHLSATLASASNSPHPNIVNLIDLYEITKQDKDGVYLHEEEFLGHPAYGAAVMTVTKQLQEQYQNLFKTASVVKGKVNYVCAVDEDFDCDMAPCLLTPKLLDECKRDNKCPMLLARRDAWKSKFGVYNYSAFLTLPDFLKKRQFFLCDEASELEDELVKHYSCNIEYSKIKLAELGMDKLQTNINGEAYRWLTDLLGALKGQIEIMEEMFQAHKKKKKSILGQISKYRQYKNLADTISSVLQSWYKAEYITEITKDEAIFTPLYVNVLAQDFFKWGDTVILMSGTIIDPETFAQTLGIKKDEYRYIEVDSGFDPNKSPIYCDTKYKLNYNNIDGLLPKLIEKALLICEHFKKDKGIIHTHTFKITEALVKKIHGQSRFLVRREGSTNENILTEHALRIDSTVLISPSLGYGTDLKDDLGRFSIIMKTPYLPLGSERIRRLAEKNRQWYTAAALKNLVQMCGRTTRSIDDHSSTFILDGTAADLIIKNKHLLPKYFIKRLH